MWNVDKGAAFTWLKPGVNETACIFFGGQQTPYAVSKKSNHLCIAPVTHIIFNRLMVG